METGFGHPGPGGNTLPAKRKYFPVRFFVFPLQNLKCYDKMGLDRNDKKITIYKMKGFGGEKQWQEK